ncbi:MAG: co-chaperone DjlA [Mariprofundaceae bacterium]
MSWLGAGIGAGIGMVIGGPIGAGIGAWIGHSVGRAKSAVIGQQEAQTIFFVSLFSMLAKMAKADGKVSPEEAALINHLAKTQIKMDAEDRKAAKQIFNNALNDDYSIFDYAEQYSQVMRNQQMREMVYRLLFAVAFADKQLHPAEDSILKEIPIHLGLGASAYHIFKEEFQGQHADLGESYEILGCTLDSSDNDIKRAYRKKCMEYHPDKLASKGLPDGFMKYAQDQMHQINDAYSAIMDSRK